MTSGREWHTATLLHSGRVLVAGDDGGPSDLNDPLSGGWHRTGAMHVDRVRHTATLLPSGRVLVAGGITSHGFSFSATRIAELYQPNTGSWVRTGSMALPRDDFQAVLLPTGKVLVAGGSYQGQAQSAAELYDPATGTWSPTGSMTEGRWGFVAILLPDGRVLAAGVHGHLVVDRIHDDVWPKLLHPYPFARRGRSRGGRGQPGV